jgi:hypothetical protein
LLPVGASDDLAIVPFGNHSLLPQRAQVGFQALTESFIGVGITVTFGVNSDE